MCIHCQLYTTLDQAAILWLFCPLSDAPIRVTVLILVYFCSQRVIHTSSRLVHPGNQWALTTGRLANQCSVGSRSLSKYCIRKTLAWLKSHLRTCYTLLQSSIGDSDYHVGHLVNLQGVILQLLLVHYHLKFYSGHHLSCVYPYCCHEQQKGGNWSEVILYIVLGCLAAKPQGSSYFHQTKDKRIIWLPVCKRRCKGASRHQVWSLYA